MREIHFITREEDGKLQQNLGEWDHFKHQLFSLAKSERELQFIGQLVEDLQFSYEEEMDKYEENEDDDE